MRFENPISLLLCVPAGDKNNYRAETLRRGEKQNGL